MMEGEEAMSERPCSNVDRYNGQVAHLKAENAELKAERDELRGEIMLFLNTFRYAADELQALAGEGADVSTPKNVDGGIHDNTRT